MLSLFLLVAADAAIVHTGAIDAARIAEQQLQLKLYEAVLPGGCARDPTCGVRPAERHLVVISAAAGAIHIELVDDTGALIAEELVAVEDPALLQAALAPALARVQDKLRAHEAPAALPPPDSGGVNGWLIAGAVAGGGFAVVTAGLLFFGVGAAAARAAEQVAGAACGAACGSITNALCTGPTESCASVGRSCTGTVDICSGFNPNCDVPSPTCNTPSCDIPSPDCNVGSCALPPGAAPAGLRGLERAPTEEGLAAGPMAY